MTTIAEARCLNVAQDLRDRATVYDDIDPGEARFLRSAADKLVRATKQWEPPQGQAVVKEVFEMDANDAEAVMRGIERGSK